MDLYLTLKHIPSFAMGGNESTFKTLQLEQEYKLNKSLFKNVNKHTKINEKDCISRIMFILKCYDNWILLKKQQLQQNKTTINMTMYDILENEISYFYEK